MFGALGERHILQGEFGGILFHVLQETRRGSSGLQLVGPLLLRALDLLSGHSGVLGLWMVVLHFVLVASPVLVGQVDVDLLLVWGELLPFDAGGFGELRGLRILILAGPLELLNIVMREDEETRQRLFGRAVVPSAIDVPLEIALRLRIHGLKRARLAFTVL